MTLVYITLLGKWIAEWPLLLVILVQCLTHLICQTWYYCICMCGTEFADSSGCYFLRFNYISEILRHAAQIVGKTT